MDGIYIDLLMEESSSSGTYNSNKNLKYRNNTEGKLLANFEEDINYLMTYYKKSLQKGNTKNVKLKKEIEMKREKLKNLNVNRNNENYAPPMPKETPKNKKEGILRKDLFIKQLLDKKIEKQHDKLQRNDKNYKINNKSLLHPTNIFFELNDSLERDNFISNQNRNLINNNVKGKSYSFYTYYQNLNLTNKNDKDKLYFLNDMNRGSVVDSKDNVINLNNQVKSDNLPSNNLNLDLVYEYTNKINKNKKLHLKKEVIHLDGFKEVKYTQPQQFIRINNDFESPLKLNNKFESNPRLSSPGKYELTGSNEKIKNFQNSEFEDGENNFLQNFNDPLNRKNFQISQNLSSNEEKKLLKNNLITSSVKLKNARNLHSQNIQISYPQNTQTSNKTNITQNTHITQFLHNSRKYNNESNITSEKTEVDEFNTLKKRNIKSIDDNYKNLLNNKSKHKNCVSICIGTTDDKEMVEIPHQNHMGPNSRIFPLLKKKSSSSILSNQLINCGNIINLQPTMGKLVKPVENLKLKVNNLQLNANYLNDGYLNKDKANKILNQNSKNLHVGPTSYLKPIVLKGQEESTKEKNLLLEEYNKLNTCTTTKSSGPELQTGRSSKSNKNIFKSKNDKFNLKMVSVNNTKLRPIQTAGNSRKEKTESSINEFINSRDFIKVDDCDKSKINPTPKNAQISARDLIGLQISPLKKSKHTSTTSVQCVNDVESLGKSVKKNSKKIIFSKLNINMLSEGN
jgi:hypothetical protein